MQNPTLEVGRFLAHFCATYCGKIRKSAGTTGSIIFANLARELRPLRTSNRGIPVAPQTLRSVAHIKVVCNLVQRFYPVGGVHENILWYIWTEHITKAFFLLPSILICGRKKCIIFHYTEVDFFPILFLESLSLLNQSE